MTTAWRHRVRRLRFALTALLAAAVIALAAAVALAQVLLPLAAHDPARVAALLSRQLGRPVAFTSLDGSWQPSGPLLTLHRVVIGKPGDAAAVHLPTAQVKFDLGALLWPSRHLVNLRLTGLQLDLARGADGRWQVAGFGRPGGHGRQLSLDDLPGNLWLENLHLNVRFAAGAKPFELLAPAVRLSNGDGRLRFAATVGRAGASSRLHLVGTSTDGGGRGRLFVQAHDVKLAPLLAGIGVDGLGARSGSGSAGLWLDWRGGRIERAALRTDLRDIDLVTRAGDVRVPAWQATVRLDRHGDDADLFYDEGEHGALRVRVRGHGSARRIDAAARDLDLRAPLALAALLPLPARWRHWLAGAHIHGRVGSASAHWSAGSGLQWAAAQFDGVGMDPVGAVPGIDTLSGSFHGDHEALALELPQQAATLRMPHTFRQPFVLSRLRGSVAAWHDDEGWHLGTGELDFDGDGYGGQARGEVLLPAAGGRPFLDLYAALDHGRVDAAKLFWPIHDMSPKAVAWLDRSLVSGNLVSGRCILRGSLNDWPFVNHHGRFEASATVQDAVLDYSPKWPRAEHVSAVAHFIDDGMLIEADAAQALGNRASHVVASIPAYHLDRLILVVQGSGPGKAMLDFVRQSPIGGAYAKAIRNLSLGGRGDIDFGLVLPLRDSAEMTLAGAVTVHDADVHDPDWGLTLKGLGGHLRFDPHGLSGQGLTARFRTVPVTLALRLGAATGDPAQPVQVQAQGRFDVPTLVQGYNSLAPLTRIAHGSALFDIGVDVDDGGKGAATTSLHVASDLDGITLDLPAPLDKGDADTALPLRLTLGLPTAGAPLRLALGDSVRALGRLAGDAGQPLALAVRLGGQWPRQVPDQGVRIDGDAGLVDLSGWAQRALSMVGDSHGSLDGVDLQVAEPELFGRRFKPLHVQVRPQRDTTTLTVAGAQIQGTLTLPTADVRKRGIVARLDRLYWPGDSAGATTAAPAAAGTAPAAAATSAAAAADAAMAMAGVAPASLPPLHLWVGDLRLGAARLGEARFESWPTAKGMHIDQLRTHSPDIQLSASGDWNGDALHNHTHLVIDFGAESLGHMLSALGFSGLFEGGHTQAHLDASWPGAPSAVKLANMQGTLSVDVGSGRIPEVQPGVGRLFGLMSIAELPRRFALDFGDVFGKGFGFDSIKGRFRFADGSAYTTDLHIKGPAADIHVSGRTGLRTHDYDQRVLMIPHLGSSLPVVGAIAGGPVGAAAGLAVQGLLGRGLNRVASARYRITGSWEHPVIKLVEKKTIKLKPKPASPADAPARAGSAAQPPASAPTAADSGG